ncbi:cyclic AMP-dependent transcription factor ATF-7b isoform X2 [Denticeps clupeoides]|uniref:cyclic AMP-dependent transcription factor ATF-7b isoform X2 n=1 Tax=Denticeps clupeoides TaxID=299321 RepID=UPI0010A58671|nr:cyclic AMP-dependent transcription factor ATF-7-like isoform X2 [Denticeps clupeoides]
MGDDRPFVCTASGCGQRFTNEDHLAVHQHKHEMSLKFGPTRTDSVIIADQTPTPTWFLKNCEEVGLFSELAGSFEQELRRPADEEARSQKKTVSSEVDEMEGSLEIDSSSPESPNSTSSLTDDADPITTIKEKTTPPRPINSAPTPTIVRPGSLPLHLGHDPLTPTLPSPTSVITRTPPSNRLSSPSGSFSVLPSPGQTSVISLARSAVVVPSVPGIPGPPTGGSTSPSAYSTHTDSKMKLKAALSQQSDVGTAPPAELSNSKQREKSSSTKAQGGRGRRATEVEPDERRRRFLERNRAAASRCRQKRKIWISALEKRAEELETTNTTLANEVKELRSEVAHLKELLLAHKDCPVTATLKKNCLDSLANGLSVRTAEAVAVLAGMGSGQWGESISYGSAQPAASAQPASR